MATREPLTLDQIAARQEKAVNFLRNVVGNDDKADEIESLSVEEYAERKGFTIANPAKSKNRGAVLQLTERRESTMSTAASDFNDPRTKAEILESEQELLNLLDEVWEAIVDVDDDSTQEQAQDACQGVAEILNDYDADTFPIDYDDDAQSEDADDTAA